MQTGREFFIHGLTDIYDAEQQLVEALGELAEDSSLGQLKKAFESHRAQTEKQVQRLQQCFELLGEPKRDFARSRGHRRAHARACMIQEGMRGGVTGGGVGDREHSVGRPNQLEPGAVPPP